MMKMHIFYRALALLLLLVSATACFNNEDDDGPRLPGRTINFGGFIKTDGDGQRTEGIDPDDWRLDVIFIREELELYPLNLSPLCSSTEGTVINPAYPNPFQDTLALQIENPDDAAIDMVIVDRFYEPQLIFPPLLLGSDSVINFSLDLRLLPSDLDTMRLYYVMGKGDCTLRGYGDILRQ
jgi:hypothetical protein